MGACTSKKKSHEKLKEAQGKLPSVFNKITKQSNRLKKR